MSTINGTLKRNSTHPAHFPEHSLHLELTYSGQAGARPVRGAFWRISPLILSYQNWISPKITEIGLNKNACAPKTQFKFNLLT